MLDGAGGFFEDLKPQFTNRRALCFQWLFQGLPQGLRAVSYFGGVGMLETVVANMLKPSEFVIYDIDKECLDQLANAFPRASVSYGDARETMGSAKYDVALVDHPYMTATRWKEWHREFTRLFATRPSYVELTVAVRRLPLLGKVYGKELGQIVTDVESYVRAISNMTSEKYGYSVSRAAYHFASVYMLLEPKPYHEPWFLHVVASEGGFRYLDN